MNIRRFISNVFDSNMYLIEEKDGFTIVDPSINFKDIKKYLKNKSINKILITHCHYDHICEVNSYLENTNSYIYIHTNGYKKINDEIANCSYMINSYFSVDLDKYKDRFILLNKDLNINYIENFGHTDCSVSYIIDDFMFTGDFIFKLGIGRYDLKTGSLNDMNKSLDNFKHLTKDYIIYPGHGDSSTVAYELKYNHYLK